MLRENAETVAADDGADFQPELEDQADGLIGFDTAWVQNGQNQRALIDQFFSTVQPGALAFLYAKRVPHTETEGRVLLGVGRVTKIGAPLVFPGDNPLATIAWESPVSHTIRPGFTDGFLLPYHEALAAANEDPAVDLEPLMAFAPHESLVEFSYGTERVHHGSAISALLACERALRAAEKVLPGSRGAELAWIDERINELWTLRGPYPGLGSALHAFGVTNGNLVARELAPLLEAEKDPWDLVARAMDDPRKLLAGLEKRLVSNIRKKWKTLPEERRDLLKLVARFDLTPDQAERWYQPDVRQKLGVALADTDILANPYVMYEEDRRDVEPIAVRTIDQGVFPDETIRRDHPLPAPTAMEDHLDVRRVRALAVDQLEHAAGGGDTLLPASKLFRRIRDSEIDPECPVDQDQLPAYGEDPFAPVVRTAELHDGSPAFQLDRLHSAAAEIRRFVTKRTGAKRHVSSTDWRARLDDLLDGGNGASAAADPEESRAREEKAAALGELYAGRFTVLVGPAGTGKTTLLRVLCDEPTVDAGGVLLLAPTGKARVRLSTELKREAQTIAQFLLKTNRYDPPTGAYTTAGGAPIDGFRTVIVDESSMLTEEQLASVLSALKGVDRFILVGDPRQLPPIGPGRPFVDIIAHVRDDALEQRFPRVAPGCAELTVPRRTAGTGADGQPLLATDRADLTLAEWFGGRSTSPGADAVWDRLRDGDVDTTLAVRSWNAPDDLRATLLKVIQVELGLSGPDDAAGFEQFNGAREYNGHNYFGRERGVDAPGAARSIERWQILSPVRADAHGVRELNRFVQRTFREATRERANDRFRKLPKPFGPEEILYGDKVISVVNDSRRFVFPKDGGSNYIANGDLGVVVGQFKSKKMSSAPWKAEVEFATQPGFAYDYRPGEFGGEAGGAPLELAYALTIHKAQGSEFGTTILVIPNPCRLLSRELLYTALTRQQKRVILLYQGDIGDLKSYADLDHSVTASRLTNVFRSPKLVETTSGSFLEEYLIHRTSRGDLVRSKSELVICEMLIANGIDFTYEQRLQFDDASFRYPDFTIEDDDTGQTVYWEHLGMLNDPVYKRRWEQKQQWYARHGVARHPEPGDRVLVSTYDDAKGGLDVAKVKALIDVLFG
jgi:hypothetical protein